VTPWRWIALAGLGCGVAGVGCGAAPMHVAALDQVEQVRATEAAREGAAGAPEVYARAEEERDLALRAHAAGDDVEASLHAERAIAAYGHALAVTRFARATAELADAEKSLGDTVVEKQSLEATRAQLERQADELQRRADVARERWLPAASLRGPAERDAARESAARSMAAEARLLCSAARLIASAADGLETADGEVTGLQKRLDDAPAATSIDDAARARARCLDVLTRARRGAKPGDGGADALLSELSTSSGWDPTRDERGIVVTIRDAYHGAQLTDGGNAKLNDLGRVATAHPGFAVQVVVHDALAPRPQDDGDARRAAAAVAALVAGGASASRIGAELAGARAPVADPSDPRVRQRNERLEIVFVGP
jgi:hypothetical protein